MINYKKEKTGKIKTVNLENSLEDIIKAKVEWINSNTGYNITILQDDYDWWYFRLNYLNTTYCRYETYTQAGIRAILMIEK